MTVGGLYMNDLTALFFSSTRSVVARRRGEVARLNF